MKHASLLKHFVHNSGPRPSPNMILKARPSILMRLKYPYFQNYPKKLRGPRILLPQSFNKSKINPKIKTIMYLKGPKP